jgi:glycosyltransferase involved in cell wall biosynthesis/GT2 family glycosyltransferase
VSTRASVVVNTLDRAESLARTLDALDRLDYADFEVVVVVGPGSDHTDAVLERYAGRVKVGRCPIANLAVSRNIGIAMASGEVVVFIDDDAYPDPAWLHEVLAPFDVSEVGVVGGPVFNHTGASFQARISFADRTGGAWVGEQAQAGALLAAPDSQVFVYPIGTNAAFRRSALVAVGGFDEEYEYYLDETDLTLRLLDRGWRVDALERGFVYHKFLPSDVRNAQRVLSRWYSVIKNRTYFALCHAPGNVEPAKRWSAIVEFVDHLRTDARQHAELGNLSGGDLLRFEREAAQALEDGEAHARRGPLTKSTDWFDEDPLDFVPFAPTGADVPFRMHLVYVIDEYPPEPVNGIARVIHSLARGMAARGHVVGVVTKGDAHDRVDLEDGVWVHRIVPRQGAGPTPPGEPFADLWVWPLTVLEEIDRIEGMRHVDLVQCPNWAAEGVAAILSGRYTTVLGLYTPIRTVAGMDHRVSLDSPRVQAFIDLERRCYEGADAFLACGPAIVDEIESSYGVELGRDRLGTVPHGIPRPDGVERDEHHESVVEILYVGRLEPRKGVDVLLEAIVPLLRDHPDVRVVLAGDDSIPGPSGATYRQEFEARFGDELGDRVRFLGRVTEQELARRYASCDIFVAPSRFESFGLILLEAMMFSKPVVGTALSGMEEIVRDGVEGRLVPPGDGAALFDALDGLVRAGDLRREMGAAGQRRYEDVYTVERMAQAVEVFYDRLLQPEVGESDVTPLPRRDLVASLRCPVCGGPLTRQDEVVVEDGRLQRGALICASCDRVAAVVENFTVDFHRAGERRAPQETVVVPAPGEWRIAGVASVLRRIGSWHHADGRLWSEEPGATVRLVESCTGALARVVRHPRGGIAEFLVDGEIVATVDLWQAEGSYVVPIVLMEAAANRRHMIEVRVAPRDATDIRGGQVMIDEVVLSAPHDDVRYKWPAPLNYGNPFSPAILRYLDKTDAGAFVLECGGGDRRTQLPNHVNFEYLPFECADVLGDIHHLPFQDSTFDLIFSQAVFEHVRDPFRAARELVRVAKPGSLVITEVAFLQPLHAVPHHYFNMTIDGLLELFAGCEVVEHDWFGELSDTVEWLFRSAGLDRRADPSRLARIVSELRELDELIEHDGLQAVASGVYLVVRTPA